MDEDPLVRAFRLPAENFESGLYLTLYGKVLRWGPGWWIHIQTVMPRRNPRRSQLNCDN